MTKRFAVLLLALCCLTLAVPARCAQGGWRTAIATNLPKLGHRNWIAIVDSAYPAQSRNGIETVVANADQITVLKAVLAAIAASRHVRPIVYTDAELKYVVDKDAPGVTTYRKQLGLVLGGRSVSSMPHDQIIAKLDDAGKTFNVLIIKTNMAIPYTSVFLQLNCKYWSDDAEKALRSAIARDTSHLRP